MEVRTSLTQASERTTQAGVETIASLLESKGRAVWSISPDATVYDAIALMAEKRVGALLVMAENRVVGMLSERDYARKVILQGHSSKETPVRDIMSAPVIGITPDHTVDEALRVMTRHRIRHLPVVQGEEIVGVVSIGDLVNALISMQAHTIDQLETYITNSYPK